jgi:hypothetical protein
VVYPRLAGGLDKDAQGIEFPEESRAMLPQFVYVFRFRFARLQVNKDRCHYSANKREPKQSVKGDRHRSM